MRGQNRQQSDMFSYLSPEQRVRKDHPFRAIRTVANEALSNISERFDAMYVKTGRPSIPPEKLLRAQLIQMPYSVRSERLLMEEIDCSVLFRWFAYEFRRAGLGDVPMSIMSRTASVTALPITWSARSCPSLFKNASLHSAT
jgi:Transposase domain (DUF772)